MKTYSYTQLVKAMLFCLPMVLAGCATSRYVPKPLPDRVVNVESSLAKSQVTDADNGMKVIPGTGVFVKPPVAGAATGGAKDILLNFEGADLREVVRVAMGDMLRENYTIDPRVNGTVTIHTSQAVSKAAVPAILETVLRMNGAAMVRENGVYKIAPLNSALRGSTTPQVGNLQPGYNVQVVPLEYISAREMAKILEPPAA